MLEFYQPKQDKILDTGILFLSRKLMRSPSVTPAITQMNQSPAPSVTNSKWESCSSIFTTPEGEHVSRETRQTEQTNHSTESWRL